MARVAVADAECVATPAPSACDVRSYPRWGHSHYWRLYTIGSVMTVGWTFSTPRELVRWLRDSVHDGDRLAILECCARI